MRLLESMFGGAGKARQLCAADNEAVAGPFMENNDVGLVDPLDSEKLLRSLEDDVDSYLRVHVGGQRNYPDQLVVSDTRYARNNEERVKERGQ